MNFKNRLSEYRSQLADLEFMKSRADSITRDREFDISDPVFDRRNSFEIVSVVDPVEQAKMDYFSFEKGVMPKIQEYESSQYRSDWNLERIEILSSREARNKLAILQEKNERMARSYCRGGDPGWETGCVIIGMAESELNELASLRKWKNELQSN